MANIDNVPSMDTTLSTCVMRVDTTVQAGINQEIVAKLPLSSDSKDSATLPIRDVCEHSVLPFRDPGLLALNTSLDLKKSVVEPIVSNYINSDKRTVDTMDDIQLPIQVSSQMVHQRIHNVRNSYKCYDCGKGFKRASALIRHQRIHIGEKPYKCTYCGKGFTESGHLAKHLRIHTGEKPYKCTVCDKEFSVSSSLNKHKLTHTGEKPYRCPACGQRYSQVGNLTRHQQRRHPEERQ